MGPPGHKILPSVSLPTKFLEEGECDLMFYKRKIAFHIIDQTIRLSDGMEIQGKSKESLLHAYVSSWYQRNGPFKLLYMDGESGLNNDESKAELSDWELYCEYELPVNMLTSSNPETAFSVMLCIS